jgi:trk system potassium uptake protein TrkH
VISNGPVRRQGFEPWPTRLSPVLYPIALALLGPGAVAVLSGLLALTDDGTDAGVLVSAGLAFSVLSVVGLKLLPRPGLRAAPAVFSMATGWFLTLMACGALLHGFTSSVETFDEAIFEGMAGATTTAMTTLDPEELGRGMLLYRAGTQWLAGLGALLLALVVIPLVSGVREPVLSAASNALNPAGTGGVRRIMRIYAALSVILVGAFLAAGMPLFDSFAHAMTTVSTGGLSTRAASMGDFESSAIEWVAGIGAAVAGLNLVVIWWILRGDHRSLRRSVQLRLYLGSMVVATGLLFVFFVDDAGAAEAIRTAFVTAASAMSTTGFVTTPWSVFDSGAQALLLVLVGIGAMAGSAGGGFGYHRVIVAMRSAYRELVRQLHPAAVRVVKLGGEVIAERRVERIHGFIITFILTGAVGATAVALGDQSVGPTVAIELTAAALVTAGPTIGEASAPTVADLGPTSHIALSAVMLLGRMAIYPALLAVMTLGHKIAWATREARFARSAGWR